MVRTLLGSEGNAIRRDAESAGPREARVSGVEGAGMDSLKQRSGAGRRERGLVLGGGWIGSRDERREGLGSECLSGGRSAVAV